MLQFSWCSITAAGKTQKYSQERASADSKESQQPFPIQATTNNVYPAGRLSVVLEVWKVGDHWFKENFGAAGANSGSLLFLPQLRPEFAENSNNSPMPRKRMFFYTTPRKLVSLLSWMLAIAAKFLFRIAKGNICLFSYLLSLHHTNTN